MAKSSGKTSPDKNGKQNLRASGSKVWYVIFFLVGLALMGVFQLVRGSIHPAAKAAASFGALPLSSKPWGEVQIIPMVLERPDEMFATNNTPAPPLRWFFPNYSHEQVADLIASCDLSPEQTASLLDPSRSEPGNQGWVLRPLPGVVKELSTPVRKKIYAVLGQSTQNAGQAFPFVYRADGFKELFAGCELSAEKVSLVRKLAYPKADLLCFADAQLFELISSSNDTRCLVKTLCRVPAVMMKLKLTPESDVDALVDYWGACDKTKGLKPLLKSMARVPGGASLNISFFFSAVPRLRLFTYPDLASPVREDCVWSSFNFFRDEPDNRLIDPAYANQVLQTDFEPARGEKRFGDLMLLLGPGGSTVHMCIYIAEEVVFTKNGGHPYQPWVLMKIKEMMVQYPSDGSQHWQVFRKKQLEKARPAVS